MIDYRDLTDEQWSVVGPLIPEPRRREDGRGRPWKGKREVLNGVLYVLRTGTAWAGLPDYYPPYQTCHRRFQQWVRTGVMGNVLEVLHPQVESPIKHFPQPSTRKLGASEL
jgi:transposase